MGRGRGPIPFPHGSVCRSPTDGDRTGKTKPKAPAALICSDKAVPGNRYSHNYLQPWADAGRAPRVPPSGQNTGRKKKQWENKPVSVLSHTIMPRREQTMKMCERGRAHRAELQLRYSWCRWGARQRLLRKSHLRGNKTVCGRKT